MLETRRGLVTYAITCTRRYPLHSCFGLAVPLLDTRYSNQGSQCGLHLLIVMFKTRGNQLHPSFWFSKDLGSAYYCVISFRSRSEANFQMSGKGPLSTSTLPLTAMTAPIGGLYKHTATRSRTD